MKRILIVLTLGLPFLCPLLAGCGNSGAGAGLAEAQSPDALLANAMESLNDDRPSIAAYSSALKQLDTYIALTRKDDAKFKLGKPEQDLIEKQLLPGLIRDGQPNDPTTRTSRVNELQRTSFTLVDAFHLDSCFLFRDAAQALRQYYIGDAPVGTPAALPAHQLALAVQAFQWVIRQVQLQVAPPGLDPWPPQDILRRGTADADERARIFLALLEQLELDGCMVTRTIDIVIDGKREPRELPWVPGVLIGNDVYLFETRLGTPFPAADGKNVATLREVLKNPDILKKLYAGDSSPVTLAQLEKPAVLIPSSYPALAPRMRELQAWLRDVRNRAIVYQDLPAVRKRFQDAKLDVEARLWTNRFGNPSLILNRHVENPKNELRLQELIVPRRALIPAWMQELTRNVNPDLARLLYRHFDHLFLSVRVQPVSIQEVEVRREGQPNIPGLSNQPERVQRRQGGVRDLLVRGRPEQTVDRVLDLETKLQKMMDLFHDEVESGPGRVEAELKNTWAPQLIAIQRRFDMLVDQRRSQGDKAQMLGLDDELRKAAIGLQGKIQEQEAMLSYVSTEWALPEINEHLTYFMALAKMELAVRAEVQASLRKPGTIAAGALTPAQQWQSAADWFERYQAVILARPRNHWASSAAQHLAFCRDAQARLEPKK